MFDRKGRHPVHHFQLVHTPLADIFLGLISLLLIISEIPVHPDTGILEIWPPFIRDSIIVTPVAESNVLHVGVTSLGVKIEERYGTKKYLLGSLTRQFQNAQVHKAGLLYIRLSCTRDAKYADYILAKDMIKLAFSKRYDLLSKLKFKRSYKELSSEEKRLIRSLVNVQSVEDNTLVVDEEEEPYGIILSHQ